jgi:serine/threonine protein kinase
VKEKGHEPPGGIPASAAGPPTEQEESVLQQAWLEEQAALYQALCEEPNRPNPVEFAARVNLPESMVTAGFDVRARLIRRLRVIDGLRQALGGQGEPGIEDFHPGDLFQDLEILEPIGKGGMGRVYRARQISLGRVVALKTPHWAASLDPREKARFWREAQAIARLRHPGIVPLFAVGQRGGTPFLVLELVEGRPLSEVIQKLKTGALPRAGSSLGREGVTFERAAAGIAIEILSALQSAHEAGIVHRDVKPGNVMLESSGRVRVLDFGLAKLQRDEELTRSREFLGTIQFTAPEILDDPRAASPISDLYSVGVLLYELLSLELPFGNLSLPALMQRALSEEPLSLHSRFRISRPLSAIVSKAMARHPESRYSNAREFAEDLEAFIRGSTVSARPTTFLERLPRFARRHLTPTGAILIGLSVTTLALVVRGLGQMQDVRAGLDSTEIRETLKRALLWECAAVPTTAARHDVGTSSEPTLTTLEERTREDRAVLFPRARVHLAVLAAERGDRNEAMRYLAELEAAGWEYETMAWIRDDLSSGKDGLVEPPAERSLESLGNDVDRFYSLRARARAAEKGAGPRLASVLERHPVYGAPVRFLEAQWLASAEPRNLAGAIDASREVLAQVPEHPVVVAALLNWSCEYVREQGWERDRAERYLTPLAQLAGDTIARQAVHSGLWTAYGSLLDQLGDMPGARSAFARGLEAARPETVMQTGPSNGGAQ